MLESHLFLESSLGHGISIHALSFSNLVCVDHINCSLVMWFRDHILKPADSWIHFTGDGAGTVPQESLASGGNSQNLLLFRPFSVDWLLHATAESIGPRARP
jgi:hypothetical protein